MDDKINKKLSEKTHTTMKNSHSCSPLADECPASPQAATAPPLPQAFLVKYVVIWYGIFQ